MNKKQAVSIFGNITLLSDALDVSRQAIYQWPMHLSIQIQDRVIGAAIRTNTKIPDDVMATFQAS